MFRGALSGGGGRGRRRSQRAAGGVRSDSRAPRRGAAAHPALGLRGPAGAKTRRADATAGSRPLGARPRAPRLGLERLGRCPARAGARARGSEAGCAGGRRAGQDWLGKQPAARSEGRVICETKFTEAQPRFSSAAWSSPLPRLRFYAPSLFF